MPSRDRECGEPVQHWPQFFAQGNMPLSSHFCLIKVTWLCLLLGQNGELGPCVWKEEENYNMDECLNNITTTYQSLTLDFDPSCLL